MIYKLVNKRTEILAIATSNTAHLCYSYKHVFALLIFMPRFNNFKVYQNWPKIKLILSKKYKKIFVKKIQRAPPPDPCD